MAGIVGHSSRGDGEGKGEGEDEGEGEGEGEVEGEGWRSQSPGHPHAAWARWEESAGAGSGWDGWVSEALPGVVHMETGSPIPWPASQPASQPACQPASPAGRCGVWVGARSEGSGSQR